MPSASRDMTSQEIDQVLGLSGNRTAQAQLRVLLDNLKDENNISSFTGSERDRFRQILHDVLSAEILGQSSRFHQSILSAFRRGPEKCIDALYSRAKLNRKAKQCREERYPRKKNEDSIASGSRKPAPAVPRSPAQPADSPAAVAATPLAATPAVRDQTPTRASTSSAISSPSSVSNASTALAWPHELPVIEDIPGLPLPDLDLRFSFVNAEGQLQTLERTLTELMQGGRLDAEARRNIVFVDVETDLSLDDVAQVLADSWHLSLERVARLPIQLSARQGYWHELAGGNGRFASLRVCWQAFLRWAEGTFSV